MTDTHELANRIYDALPRSARIHLPRNLWVKRISDTIQAPETDEAETNLTPERWAVVCRTAYQLLGYSDLNTEALDELISDTVRKAINAAYERCAIMMEESVNLRTEEFNKKYPEFPEISTVAEEDAAIIRTFKY